VSASLSCLDWITNKQTCVCLYIFCVIGVCFHYVSSIRRWQKQTPCLYPEMCVGLPTPFLLPPPPKKGMSLEVDRALINRRIESEWSISSREVRTEGLLIIRLSPLRSRRPTDRPREVPPGTDSSLWLSNACTLLDVVQGVDCVHATHTCRHSYSMDSLVDVVTRGWTSRSGNRGSVPGGRDNYYLLAYLLSYLPT
jgi:hypothetical protein